MARGDPPHTATTLNPERSGISGARSDGNLSAACVDVDSDEKRPSRHRDATVGEPQDGALPAMSGCVLEHDRRGYRCSTETRTQIGGELAVGLWRDADLAWRNGGQGLASVGEFTHGTGPFASILLLSLLPSLPPSPPPSFLPSPSGHIPTDATEANGKKR